jgi:signal transduction histidine kinase/DNA-binding response OmpR family regulator
MSNASLNLLLVEDDPADAFMLQHALREAAPGQFEVAHVDRLEKGLAHLAAGGVDEVLLDLSLPDAQGIDTLLRARLAAHGVPIVVLTGLSDEALARRALQGGAQDYLVKGQMDNGLLVRALRYAVERQQLTAEIERKNAELERQVAERVRAEGELARKNEELERQIAERTRIEATVRESARRLRRQKAALVDLARSRSIAQGDLEAAVREIAEAATRTLETPRAAVWLYDDDRTLMRAVDLYEQRWDTHSSGAELAAEHCPRFFAMLEEERTIAVPAAQGDPRTGELLGFYLGPHAIASLLIAPIRVRGCVRGILTQECVGYPRQWSLDEQSFTASLGDLVALAIEASESRRPDDRAREDARLRALVQHAPGMLLGVDAQGVLTAAEGRGLERLGLEPARLVGASFFEVFRDAPELSRSLRRAITSEESSACLELGGTALHVSFAAIRDRLGQVTGLAGWLGDATAIRRAEERARQLAARAWQSQRLESLARVTAHVGQDLGAMVAGLLDHTRTALDAAAAGTPLRRAVQRAHAAGLRAAAATRQLLTYAGKHALAVQPLDPAVLLRELAPLIEAWISKRITVEYRIGGDLPLIEADPTLLRQIVLSLIRNASDAIGNGEGLIRIAAGTVEVDRAHLAATHHAPHASEGRYLSLEVSDSGAGMDAATLARLFEPFFTTKPGGRGIGLATALGIVRAHGGAVRVESAPEAGTTVGVLLPASRRRARAAGGSCAEPREIERRRAG